MKIGNNQLCPCGSKKKYKRCCRDKKTRDIVVEGSFNQPMIADSFAFRPSGGRVGIFFNGREQIPDRVASLITYDRSKGRKVLSKMPGISSATMAYVDTGLLQFDKIVSIDTNTKDVDSNRACVVASVMMTPHVKLGGLELRGAQAIAIEFWNPVYPPERIGWRMIMDAVSETNEYICGKRYGIIVDSELGRMDAFNSREEEILPGFMLPERMTMIYGSSDSKNDSAVNKMLHMTDKASNAIHSRMAADGYSRSEDNISDSYTDWRQWSDVELAA